MAAEAALVIAAGCVQPVIRCLETDIAAAYLNALRRLGDTFGLKDDISIMTVAQNRELFLVKKGEEDAEKDWAELRTVLDEALAKFLAAREREGRRRSGDGS